MDGRFLILFAAGLLCLHTGCLAHRIDYDEDWDDSEDPYEEDKSEDDVARLLARLMDEDSGIAKRDVEPAPPESTPASEKVEVTPEKTENPLPKSSLAPKAKEEKATALEKDKSKGTPESNKSTDLKDAKKTEKKPMPIKTPGDKLGNAETKKPKEKVDSKEELELTSKLLQALERSIVQQVSEQLQQKPTNDENVVAAAGKNPEPDMGGKKKVLDHLPTARPSSHDAVHSNSPSDTLYSQPLEQSQRSCLAHDSLDEPVKAYVTVNGKKQAIFHDNGDGKGYLLKGLEQTAMDKNKDRAIQFDFIDPVALMSVEFGNFAELRGVMELSVEVRREDTGRWRWLEEKEGAGPRRFNLDQGTIKMEPILQLSEIRFYPQKWSSQPILPRPRFIRCTEFDDQ